MAVQSVSKMGDMYLGCPSLPVTDFNDPALSKILKDMQDTMIAKGGVGIAAPQIGVNLRIILFGFESNARYPQAKPVPMTVLINPWFEIRSDEMEDAWEGCLSVPGLRGLVSRYTNICYSGYDLDGQVLTRHADHFHARVVQHEIDHLDGILFPQRIKDLRYFGFEDSLDPSIYQR